MNKERDSFWKRISYKYRLSVMNEDTLTEAWHIRLSRLGFVMLMTLMFFLTLGIFAVLIIYTPIRNVLPGYSESIRQQLISQTTQVDSLATNLALQQQYLDIIKQIAVGEVTSDSVQSLDSLQIVAREQLLAAKSEVTEQFIAQYEEKGRDNLQLFDVQQTIPVLTFFRPVHGVIVAPYSEEEGRLWVEIKTPEHENVTSVLAGVVVMVNLEINNTYTVVVQHGLYLSQYRNLSRVLKHVGDALHAGENLAFASDELPLIYQLWQDGRSVNPEEVIAF